MICQFGVQTWLSVLKQTTRGETSSEFAFHANVAHLQRPTLL
jgi:hypothetical protein